MTWEIRNKPFTLSDCPIADVMICDPPYSAHVHDNATSQSGVRGTRHRDLGFTSLDVGLRIEIAQAIGGQVKRWALIYSDIEGLGAWRDTVENAHGSYIRAMPWVRWSMPQLSGDRPPQGFELITAYWGGGGSARKSWNGPGNLTHLAHRCLRGEDKHKCEKPLDQALDLVSWFSNPGELVIDPCMGSGTIGLACQILGRDFIGWEIDPIWIEKARIRLTMGIECASPRDAERYERWQATQAEANADTERRRAHTAKVRAKLDESKCNK